MSQNFKIFLVKIAAVACVLIVVDVVAGFGLKNLFYKQRGGKYYKISHAVKNTTEDIVIFGSSHASEHFDAPLMQKLTGKTTFNFGNQGQSILYTYPLVKSILAYHKPLLIIVNLDYSELQYKSEAYERLSILMPYFHVNSAIDSAIALMPDHQDLKCYSALYRYNSTLGNIMLNTYSKKIMQLSYNNGYEQISGNICNVDRTENPQNEIGLVRFDQHKIDYLIKLAGAAQKANVKLLITTTPLYNYNPAVKNVYKEKLIQILNQLTITYLDGGTNADFKGKCQYFSDDTHLNPQGADGWTTLCSQYIKSKLL
ncbi:MAG: hypothetical protein V4553_12010 [Bacteroidota bacterium]